MTKFSVLISLVLILSLFGCGSETTERPTANVGRNQPSNTGNSNSAGGPASSNTAATASAVNETSNADIRNKKLKDIRAAGGDPSVPKPDMETVLKGSERPAPENSVFAVALVDNVVERRTFLKHPVIAKVEKVTTGDGRSSLKVVTRDGKSFDLEGNAVGPVSTASTTTIMRAIGLEAPASDRKQRPAAPPTKN